MNWPLTIETYDPLTFLLIIIFLLFLMLLLALGVRRNFSKIERKIDSIKAQPSGSFLAAIKAVDKMDR